MILGDIDLTQTEEPLMDTSVEVIPPTSDRVSIAIVETGSGNTPLVPTPAWTFWKNFLSKWSGNSLRQ